MHLCNSREGRQAPATIIKSDFREVMDKFSELLKSVISQFEALPGGLEKLKEISASLLLPVNDGSVVPIIPTTLYLKAKTVSEFFSLISPLVNPLSFHLLCTLSRLCDCKLAYDAATAYGHFLTLKCHLVLCVDRWSAPTNPDGLNDLNILQQVPIRL